MLVILSAAKDDKSWAITLVNISESVRKEPTMRPWEAVVPVADREVYAKSGLGQRRPSPTTRRPSSIVP